MNSMEKNMVVTLKELKQKFHIDGVKAEFEAEGTRIEELIRLKEICLAADVKLTLKIGGCEAIRDMYNARSIGVDFLVAPMVETAFSLQKYLRAVKIVFPADELENIGIVVNIETETAVGNFDAMMKIPEFDLLDGIVMGRGDYTGSLSLDRTAVNSERIFNDTKLLLTKARSKGLECAVGGVITVDSLPFLRNLRSLIDRYETRKVCFSCPQSLGAGAEQGITMALWFELLWLGNKKAYYKTIAEEDDKRIATLEARFKKS